MHGVRHVCMTLVLPSIKRTSTLFRALSHTLDELAWHDAGLFDQLATQHPGSCLLGFLNGPRGIINCDVREITASAVVRVLLCQRRGSGTEFLSGGSVLICLGRAWGDDLIVWACGDYRTHTEAWLVLLSLCDDHICPAFAYTDICGVHFCPLQEPYRQQGGFNIIGSGRDKIESVEHLQAAADTAAKLGLDGLVCSHCAACCCRMEGGHRDASIRSCQCSRKIAMSSVTRQPALGTQTWLRVHRSRRILYGSQD